MKFNQIRHNDTTCHSKIQRKQLQVHACKAVHPNCKLLAQAVQLNRRNRADHHSPCVDCGLGTRARARSSRRHVCILHNCNQKVQVRKKNMEKRSVSDGKRFINFVLLGCFIDFQSFQTNFG